MNPAPSVYGQVVLLAALLSPLGCSQPTEWDKHAEMQMAVLRDGDADLPKLDGERVIHSAIGEAKGLGAVDDQVAMALNVLGILYAKEDQYDEAELLLGQAIAKYQDSVGLINPFGASVLTSLAVVRVSLGKYELAEDDFWRAVTLNELVYGKGAPQVALPLHGLAFLYTLQGWYYSAELLYERELTILVSALGPSHPRLATTLRGLAVAHTLQGNYGAAEPLFQQALEIAATAGPENPTVIPILDSYADLLRRMGRDQDAQDAELRASAIETAILDRQRQGGTDARRDVKTQLGIAPGLPDGIPKSLTCVPRPGQECAAMSPYLR